MTMVTKLNRKTLRAQEKSGHHNAPGGNQEVAEVVRSARLCVACQHSSSGTCRTQILTALRTFRQRVTYSSACRKRLQDCHRNFLPRRPNSAFHVRINCTTATFLESHIAAAALNTRASSSRSSNSRPTSCHVFLLASNTVPQTRSP